MKDTEWFKTTMRGFDDEILGKTVVVNEGVFRELRGDSRAEKMEICGYFVSGSKIVGKDEIFFPGCGR